MKLGYLLGAVALAALGTSANAAVTISAVPGSATYTGTPTFDFEGSAVLPALFTGGAVKSGSSAGSWEPPLGTGAGNFWSVGPSTSSPGTLDLSGYAALDSLSFIWGSIDNYNTLEVWGKDNVLLGSWTGDAVEPTASGSTTIEEQNPLVTLSFNDQAANIGKVVFLSSSTNAFETDNFTVTAVPEPGTWLMMLLGFGLLGGVMRAGKRQTAPRVRFAM